MNPKLSKMARAGLRWNRDELSRRCGVSVVSLCHFESGYYIKQETLNKILKVFEDEGVEFFENEDRICVSIPTGNEEPAGVKKYANASSIARRKNKNVS